MQDSRQSIRWLEKSVPTRDSAHIAVHVHCPASANAEDSCGAESAALGPCPMVLVHGITAQSHSFNCLVRYLKHPDGVVAVDLRGRGNSSRVALPPAHEGMRTHAQDLEDILVYLGIERAVVVGHSMGCFVAIVFAHMFPSRTRAIVLLDGGFPRSPSAVGFDEETRAGVARAFSRLTMKFADLAEYIRFWAPGKTAEELANLPIDVRDNYAYDLRPLVDGGGFQPKCQLEAAGADANYMNTIFFTEDEMKCAFRNSTIPGLLVVTEFGFLPGKPPMMSEERVQQVRDALGVQTVLRVAQADHYSLLQDPCAPLVADAIQDFVRQNTLL